jgi:methionyl-tRNA formyltransferase
MADNSYITIAQEAKAAGIPTFTRAHPPDYTGDWSIAAGWRWMLDTPNLIVLHDSLLPRYRGFSPLITALCNGDPEVGVTAFLAEGDLYDAGPIIMQSSLPVTYPATVHSVISRMIPVYRDIAERICAVLRYHFAGGPPMAYTAQDESLATYSVWRDEDDYRIDWSKDDRVIQRQIDACSHPFPGAWTSACRVVGPGAGTNVGIVRIFDAVIEPEVRFEQRHPGKVAFVRDGQPVVVCGAGMVRILKSSVEIPFRTRLV